MSRSLIDSLNEEIQVLRLMLYRDDVFQKILPVVFTAVLSYVKSLYWSTEAAQKVICCLSPAGVWINVVKDSQESVVADGRQAKVSMWPDAAFPCSESPALSVASKYCQPFAGLVIALSGAL